MSGRLGDEFLFFVFVMFVGMLMFVLVMDEFVLTYGYLIGRNGTLPYRDRLVIVHISEDLLVLIDDILILAYLLCSFVLAVVFVFTVGMSAESYLEFLIAFGCLSVYRLAVIVFIMFMMIVVMMFVVVVIVMIVAAVTVLAVSIVVMIFMAVGGGEFPRRSP